MKLHESWLVDLTENVLEPAQNTQNRSLYEMWQGICYMWSPGGPITTGVFPASGTLKEDKQAASRLKQKSMKSCKVELSKKLKLV